MKKSLMILFAVIFVFSGSALSQTNRNYLKGIEKAPMYRWWIDNKPAKEFNITTEEAGLLDAVYKKTMTNIIDWKLASRKAILELEMEMSKVDYNEKISLENFKKIQELRAAISVERFVYFMDVRKIIGNKRFIEIVEKYHKRDEEIKRKLQKGNIPTKNSD